MRELTTKELSRPYSKYYFMNPTLPNPEIAAFVDRGPMNSEYALPITEVNQLLEPGYDKVEVGYCQMPDKTSYVAMLTKMPGVTREMIEWWFYWHGLESLRYAIWSPEDHYYVHVSPDTVMRRLDESLSYRERNWNTTDIVTENVGMGTVKLAISFMSPEKFGFDMEKFEKANVSAICANVSMIEPTPGKMECFCHFVRETGDGVEIRHRFWKGMHVYDGVPQKVRDDNPIKAAYELCAHHCPTEYTNLSGFLPLIFAEEKNRQYDPNDFIVKG